MAGGRRTPERTVPVFHEVSAPDHPHRPRCCVRATAAPCCLQNRCPTPGPNSPSGWPCGRGRVAASPWAALVLLRLATLTQGFLPYSLARNQPNEPAGRSLAFFFFFGLFSPVSVLSHLLMYKANLEATLYPSLCEGSSPSSEFPPGSLLAPNSVYFS